MRQSARRRKFRGDADQFWLWSMQGGLKNVYDSNQGHFRRRLFMRPQEFDVPTLVCMVKMTKSAIDISGRDRPSSSREAKELFYPGLPHGLTATNADQVTPTAEIPEVGSTNTQGISLILYAGQIGLESFHRGSQWRVGRVDVRSHLFAKASHK